MFISLPLLGHGGTDAVHADLPRHGRPAWADGADDAVSGAAASSCPYPCPCTAGDGDGVGLVDVVGGPRDRYVYFAACYVTCLSVFYRNPALKYILTRSCSAHYSSLIGPSDALCLPCDRAMCVIKPIRMMAWRSARCCGGSDDPVALGEAERCVPGSLCTTTTTPSRYSRLHQAPTLTLSCPSCCTLSIYSDSSHLDHPLHLCISSLLIGAAKLNLKL